MSAMHGHKMHLCCEYTTVVSNKGCVTPKVRRYFGSGIQLNSIDKPNKLLKL